MLDLALSAAPPLNRGQLKGTGTLVGSETIEVGGTMNRRETLTAVVAALDTFDEVRDALTWLHRQTARDCLEIMLVCEDASEFGLPPDAQQQVGPLRIVECGKGKTLAEARAIGCRAAETPFVGFFEDHAFLEPAWCERVLTRLEEGWSGVGGAFLSANPQTRLARAQLLVAYGEWMHPVDGGEMTFISGHGSVYSREMLMAHDEELEGFFVAEAMMMAEFRRQGHRLFCEPEAVSWHFDASRLGDRLTATLDYPPLARSLAAQRSRGWPAWRRLLYGAAFPLIGLVRWRRAGAAFVRTRAYTGFSFSSLLVAGGLAFLWSFNEWQGFWFGYGDSLQQLSDFEHNRKQNLRQGEWPDPRRPAGMSEEEFRRRTSIGRRE